MKKIVLILGAVGAVFLTSTMPLLKERVGEAFPLKEMSRGVAHSKTRDNHLPNPAVIQEPPLSKERPISRTVATGSVL
jgi:hypothetical protein